MVKFYRLLHQKFSFQINSVNTLTRFHTNHESVVNSSNDDTEIDLTRGQRTGFSEVILGSKKKARQISKIIDRMLSDNQAVLVTRIGKSKYRRVNTFLDGPVHQKYNKVAKVAAFYPEGHLVASLPGRVAVVSAGTSDRYVVEEAVDTLQFYGAEHVIIQDVGVAGIHRVLKRSEDISEATVAIVIAGMDGALPAVVAGLVSTPVIAVPTSVGYGASMKGISALLTMMNSCSTGMAVTNIDNGFGAAQLACSFLKKLKDS